MRLAISTILEETSKLTSKQDKIEFLRKNYTPVLTQVIRAALDPGIKWVLPEGKAPYKPSPYPGQEGALYSEARRLYLFIEGGNPNLTSQRREYLFIQMLEVLMPGDAELIMAAKDKKMPYKGITIKLVNEAFPGLITE